MIATAFQLVEKRGLGELVSGYQSEGGLPPTHQPPLVVASGRLSPSIHYCDLPPLMIQFITP